MRASDAVNTSRGRSASEWPTYGVHPLRALPNPPWARLSGRLRKTTETSPTNFDICPAPVPSPDLSRAVASLARYVRAAAEII